ncbi:PR-1-like protein [Apiospora arundinis]
MLRQTLMPAVARAKYRSSTGAADVKRRGDGGGRCDFKHSGGPYGENLALGCSNATSCAEAWGDEHREYDFGKGDFGESTGHFTQLGWKDTTSVGCGARMCGGSDGSDDGDSGSDARGWYLVCEYWPRGNVIGKFGDEVQA